MVIKTREQTFTTFVKTSAFQDETIQKITEQYEWHDAYIQFDHTNELGDVWLLMRDFSSGEVIEFKIDIDGNIQ